MNLRRLLSLWAVVLSCAVVTGLDAQDDSCADALAGAGVGEGTFPFDNTGYTLDGPIDCDVNMTTDAWFLYTASVTDTVIINTCETVGTLDDTTLIVYDASGGCPVTPDPGLACDDDGCGPVGFNSEVQVAVTVGDVLLIQVGGWNGSEGDGTLSIEVVEDCFDGIDNDGDGLTDCDDVDCTDDCVEICADGIDNDADALVDCDDPECAAEPSCAPVNDLCVDAIAVAEGIFAFDNAAAGLDGPIDCDPNMTGDVWYRYTAAFTGLARIDTCQSVDLDDTTLIVYDGTACPAAPGSDLACDDDSCGPAGFNSEVLLAVTAGESYYIQVGGWNGSTGDGVLSIAILDNDDCLGATPIGDGTFAYDFAGATLDGPSFSGSIDRDVWFEYTATTTTVIGFETCDGGIGPDTIIAVYDTSTAGCVPAAGSQIAFNDDDCFVQSRVEVPVVAGETYLIQVGQRIGGGGGDDGAISADRKENALHSNPPRDPCDDGRDNDGDGLTDCLDPDCFHYKTCKEVDCSDGVDDDLDGLVDCDDPDCADSCDCLGVWPFFGGEDCAAATAVSEGRYPFIVGASTDGPTDCDPDLTLDRWFLYTPTLTGTACVNTCDCDGGTLLDTVLIIYDGVGGCPSAPDFGLACNDDSCGVRSEIVFPVVAGVPVYVQVGRNGLVGATGRLTIKIVEDCADGLDNDADGLIDCGDPECIGTAGCPVNDFCVDALPIGEGSYPFDNLAASLEGPIDCDVNMSTDVWYLYTASVTGIVHFDTCTTIGTLTDTVIIVYDGAACPDTTGLSLACDDDSCGPTGFNSDVTLSVTAGDSFYVQVGGWNGSTGDATLTIAAAESVCDDGVDNDGDGNVDCADSDCFGTAPCVETGPECSDGIDNDGDGSIDCLDSDCVGSTACTETGFECADGIDNDGDGDIDCADIDCLGECACSLIVYSGETDLIINYDGIDGDEGLVASASALETALLANGYTVLTANSSIIEASCVLDELTVERIWVITGTFPSDNRPGEVGDAVGELTILADAQASGRGVYFEGGDQWGFLHVDSPFDDIDGVENDQDPPEDAPDGGDLVIGLDGADASSVGGPDFSAFSDVIYTQDQAGSDWTDELVVASTDPDVLGAAEIWGPDDALGVIGELGGDFATAIFADATGGGNVISSSVAFGGIGDAALQEVMAEEYATTLVVSFPLVAFARGDSNNDGAVNIADAVYGANALFVPGSPPPPCLDAGDANDDGLFNIADVIFTANFLFIMGSPAPPAPFPSCGGDPTADSLDCGSFVGTGC